MSKLKSIFISSLTCIILACAPAIHSPQKDELSKLKERIAYLISDPNLFNAQVGVYIESLSKGDVIFKQNEQKLFISASNMKMYTTSAALLYLGPDFRYKTRFVSNGAVEKGILSGDLIVLGSGDPSISPRFHDGDIKNLFKAWADSLSALGITKISGNLIGDASYFQNPPLGNGWAWDDQPWWYSAQINALSVNDNCIDVYINPAAKIGDPPSVLMQPTDTYMTLDNQAVTVASDSVNELFLTRVRAENRLIVKNNFPINFEEYSESISVENPAKLFMHILVETLADNGIEFSGEIRINHSNRLYDQSDLQALFTHRSPPLLEIIDVINKRSHNLYAEQLLLTIAAEYGTTASARTGTQLVTNKLAAMGIPETEFRMQDGSGLARKNLISPRATALLLRYMANHRYAMEFYNSLPIAGVDGTLKNRMLGTAAVSKTRAKTGYVGYARNLSGYVDALNGERFIFSILVNNYTIPTPAINLLQDRICAALAQFNR